MRHGLSMICTFILYLNANLITLQRSLKALNNYSARGWFQLTSWVENSHQLKNFGATSQCFGKVDWYKHNCVCLRLHGRFMGMVINSNTNIKDINIIADITPTNKNQGVNQSDIYTKLFIFIRMLVSSTMWKNSRLNVLVPIQSIPTVENDHKMFFENWSFFKVMHKHESSWMTDKTDYLVAKLCDIELTISEMQAYYKYFLYIGIRHPMRCKYAFQWRYS